MIRYQSIFKWFLISSILAVSVSYKSLYFYHIMLVILLLYNLIKHTIKHDTLRNNTVSIRDHYFFFFFFIWYSLSMLWSINFSYSLVYLFYLFCGISISLSVIYYSITIDKLEYVFKICAIFFVIEIILSIFEVFTPFRLLISPYSRYVGLFGREVLSANLLSAFESVPTGFRWNSNNLATAMNIILPFFLLHFNKKVRILGILSILTIIIASSSRANFIAFLVILLFYGLFSKWTKKIALFYFAAILLNILIIFKEQITNLFPAVGEVFTSFIALKVFLFSRSVSLDSIGARQQLIQNGLEALKNSFGLGVGAGGSAEVQELAGKVGGVYTSMHNFWIETLVDGGILFFLIFVVWYISIMYKLFKIALYSKQKRIIYFANASLLSLIGFIPGAMSASSVIYFSPMWLLFGFSISVINIDRMSKKMENPHK